MANGQTSNFCLNKCKPKLFANDCSGDLACLPRSTIFVDGKIDQAVCLFFGCTSDSDCPILTGTACSPAKPCQPGQTCVTHNTATTHGVCANPGKSDKISSLCAPHNKGNATAKVGDPCKQDTDCGNNMSCRMEVDRSLFQKKWKQSCKVNDECCSGVCQSGLCTKRLCTVDNRNGYCVIRGCIFSKTLPTSTCPVGSACNWLYTGGVCQSKCTLAHATGCRGVASDRYGDYECRAWNSLSLGGTSLAKSPVCDFGTQMPCDFLQASTLQCTDVGLNPNTTQMACRSLDGKKLTLSNDPTGYCLDTTSSNSIYRSPMPTP